MTQAYEETMEMKSIEVEEIEEPIQDILKNLCQWMRLKTEFMQPKLILIPYSIPTDFN
jgi:hypothetical protein